MKCTEVLWKPTEIPQEHTASMFIKISQKARKYKIDLSHSLYLWSIQFHYITILEYP
jgi:hypothetical protein